MSCWAVHFHFEAASHTRRTHIHSPADLAIRGSNAISCPAWVRLQISACSRSGFMLHKPCICRCEAEVFGSFPTKVSAAFRLLWSNDSYTSADFSSTVYLSCDLSAGCTCISAFYLEFNPGSLTSTYTFCYWSSRCPRPVFLCQGWPFLATSFSGVWSIPASWIFIDLFVDSSGDTDDIAGRQSDKLLSHALERMLIRKMRMDWSAHRTSKYLHTAIFSPSLWRTTAQKSTYILSDDGCQERLDFKRKRGYLLCIVAMEKSLALCVPSGVAWSLWLPCLLS